MAERRPFLVRIDGGILEAVRRWADDDLRSLNGQIEYLLRRALAEAGRLDAGDRPAVPPASGPANADETDVQ
jgi:hypothetical protein